MPPIYRQQPPPAQPPAASAAAATSAAATSAASAAPAAAALTAAAALAAAAALTAALAAAAAAALAAAFAVLGSKVRSGVFLVVDVERRQADVSLPARNGQGGRRDILEPIPPIKCSLIPSLAGPVSDAEELAPNAVPRLVPKKRAPLFVGHDVDESAEIEQAFGVFERLSWKARSTHEAASAVLPGLEAGRGEMTSELQVGATIRGFQILSIDPTGKRVCWNAPSRGG